MDLGSCKFGDVVWVVSDSTSTGGRVAAHENHFVMAGGGKVLLLCGCCPGMHDQELVFATRRDAEAAIGRGLRDSYKESACRLDCEVDPEWRTLRREISTLPVVKKG